MQTIDVPDQRILQGVAATLRWVNVDQEGEPAAPVGTVTVGINRADGTELVAAGTATSAGDDTGERTATLTAAQTATLDLLTATWTDASAGARTTKVEVVGGYLFGIGELRTAEPTLANAGKYPSEAIVEARTFVEVEAERIIGYALVPRARRVTLDGTGERDLMLPDAMVRSIVSVTADGTALTAGQLAELSIVGEHRNILRKQPGDYWHRGDGANIVVAYTHGLDRPQRDVAHAAMRRCRFWLNKPTSGQPENADNYQPAGGQSVQLADRGEYRTGLPEVDAVYLARSIVADGAGDGTAAPYSRPLQYDPQHDSLFHGGIR